MNAYEQDDGPPLTDWQAAELAILTGARPARTGIHVIIPARDEREGLRHALESVTSQSVRPDLVTVVVNNSSDDTAQIACKYAATRPWVNVLVMPGRNPHKKAGALNYGISSLLDAAGRLPASVRLLVTMDGDSVLHRLFCERASKIMSRNQRLGGVSAACLAKTARARSLLSRALLYFQHVEYGRASWARLRTQVHTMSGAGSVYRASAVNDVLAHRPHLFEQRATNLVEDYETSLYLQVRGWRITVNQHLIAWTDTMPTGRMLMEQRTRWTRGTMDEWRRYGWLNPLCRRSVAYLALGFISFATLTCSGAMLAMTAAHGGALDPRWLVLAGSWATYQGLAVRHMGWRVVALEMSLAPGLAMALLRTWWVTRSAVASFRGAVGAWH
jgi:cellulose synthase/poly-beta-1,6-N-acetylglucosamine synthase-like glycosyltransferase